MSTITIIQGNSNDKDNTRAYMVKGEAGVSPTVSVERTTGGAIVTTTDYEGTHTAQVNDGVSPTVETSKTAGVTTITITDYEGEHTATIDDGETYEVPTGSIIGFEGSTIPTGYEEVDNPFDYSTTETKVGTWIAGQAIYRKVIHTGAIQSTVKTVAHNISNLGRVIHLYGMANTNQGYYFTLPRLDTTSLDHFISLDINSTAVTIGAGSDADFVDSYVIIEYIKSTN